MNNQEPYYSRNPSVGAQWGYQQPSRDHPSRFQSDYPAPWSSRPRPTTVDSIPYDSIPLREVRVPEPTATAYPGVEHFPTRSEGPQFYQSSHGFEKSFDRNGSGVMHLSTLAPLTTAAAAAGIPLTEAGASSSSSTYNASHLFGPASESHKLNSTHSAATTTPTPTANQADASAVPRWLRYAAFGLVGITAVGLAFRLYRDHCAQTAKLRGQQIAEAEKLRASTTAQPAVHSPAKSTAGEANPFPFAATSNWIDCDGGEEIHPYTPRWDRASTSDITSPTKDREGAFNDWDVVGQTQVTSSGTSHSAAIHRTPRNDTTGFIMTSSAAEDSYVHEAMESHRPTSPVSIPSVGIVTTAFHELTQDEVGSLTSTDDPRGSVGGGSMTTAAGLSSVTSPALKPTPANSTSHHQETDGDSFTWLPSAMYV